MQKNDTEHYWMRNFPLDVSGIPVISGGSDDDSGDNGDGEDDGTEGQDEEKFTASHVEKISTKEKSRGRRQGRRELLEELGVDSVDAVKELLEKAKGGENSKGDKSKDDDSAAVQAAADEKIRKANEERDRAKEEAAQLRFDQKVERQLIAEGVSATAVEKVRRMLALEISEDGDDYIEDAVEDLKGEFPHLFSSGDSDDGDGETGDDGKDNKSKSGPPNSDPGRSAKLPPKGSAAERAKQRLHARHPELAKS